MIRLKRYRYTFRYGTLTADVIVRFLSDEELLATVDMKYDGRNQYIAAEVARAIEKTTLEEKITYTDTSGLARLKRELSETVNNLMGVEYKAYLMYQRMSSELS